MLRLLIATALLTAFVLVVGPWPLGPAPIDETPQGKAALEGAAELGASVAKPPRVAAAQPRAERAGLGRREIAVPLGPERGVLLGGYGIRAGIRPMHSLDVDPGNPCVARALALETRRGLAVLLTCDLLYVGVETRRRVLEALAQDPGIPMERVMFTATHDHSAPGEYAGGPAEAIAVGKFREEVVQDVVDAFVGAARDAAKDLAPARLTVGRREVPAYTRNRYWKEGEREPPPPVDADLTLLRVWSDERGTGAAPRLRGLFAVYGAHGTCIGPWIPRVSGEWCGAFSQALERAHPGAVALYAAGPVGSQAPVPPAVPHDAAHGGDSEDERGFFEARAMGEALALEADQVSEDFSPRRGNPSPTPPAEGSAAGGALLETRELPLPPVLFRLAPGWRATPGFVSWLYPTPERAPFSALRVGDDLFLGVPAEVSGEVSLAMKAAAARAAPGTRLTVTSFAGHYHGYVPPDECYPRFRYENTLSLHGERHGAFLVEVAAAVAAGAPK